jgi:hypothetical protein
MASGLRFSGATQTAPYHRVGEGVAREHQLATMAPDSWFSAWCADRPGLKPYNRGIVCGGHGTKRSMGIALSPASTYASTTTGKHQWASVAERPVALPPA